MYTLSAIEADLVLSLLGQIQENNNISFSLKEKLKAAGATEKFSVGVAITATLKPAKWVTYRDLKPGRWEIDDDAYYELIITNELNDDNQLVLRYYLIDSLGKYPVKMDKLWDKEFRLLE